MDANCLQGGGILFPSMMWLAAKFYTGSRELAADELQLAAIFREKGREDLAVCVVEGRKAQRLFFALGPESSFLDRHFHIFLQDSSGPSNLKMRSGKHGRARFQRNRKMMTYFLAC